MESLASTLPGWAGVSGVVVLLRPPGYEPPSQHEAATQAAVARMLAELKGYQFAGVHDRRCRYPGRVFFVPPDALMAAEAAQLGITGADDLFGGVVPYPFVKTKAISHALTGPHAVRPEGWSDVFTTAVAGCVLPGFTAFALDDARAGGRRLLDDGPVRVKPPLSAGGRGQRVARTLGEVDAAVAGIAPDDLAACGVVLEANLPEVATLSIGQVTVDGRTASYVGSQDETRDNAGRTVYGGSELTVVRGGWAALGRVDLDPAARQAIAHAVRYDAAADAFPGFLASRRNYDVAVGVDARGRRRVGVFEASWRPGGASPAEIVALQALSGDPTIGLVRVATVERYGDDLDVPGDAVVHFRGRDAVAGPVVRYTRLAGRVAA